MKKNNKKKLTSKEIEDRLAFIYNACGQLNRNAVHMQNIFDFYLEMKGDLEKFGDFIQKKMKEQKNDTSGKQPGSSKDSKK